MRRIEKRLSKSGYQVINLTYPSSKFSIEEIADNFFAPELAKYSESKIHFIGFSMGNLIIRYLLAKHRPKNLGRVVMLAPPNQGSAIADFLMSNQTTNFFFKRIFGKAGQQLGTKSGRVVLPNFADYELGIIAARLDTKVSIKNTKLDGMKEHIVVLTNHTSIAQLGKVARFIDNFLKFGTFKKVVS